MKGNAEIPDKRKIGYIKGLKKAPKISAPPVWIKIPEATIKGNKEGNTLENQRERLSAPEYNMASGKANKQTTIKQAQNKGKFCLRFEIFFCFCFHKFNIPPTTFQTKYFVIVYADWMEFRLYEIESK